VDSNGQVVASYTYDAWGKVLTATSEMAAINPIRYRGYYYDTETGLYYLNSRYYDPETGRFVNADGYVSTGQGVLGNNMFAYCGNNPVNYADFFGQLVSSILQFFETIATACDQTTQELYSVYATCASIALADGPIPIGDLIAVTVAASLTIIAINGEMAQANSTTAFLLPWMRTKSKEREEESTENSESGRTYYHVTSPQYAASIMDSSMLKSGVWEKRCLLGSKNRIIMQ
jgi:RHS repeat-associated protein